MIIVRGSPIAPDTMKNLDNATEAPSDGAKQGPQPDCGGDSASIADNARRMLAVSRAYLSDGQDLA
jgi:hypothetical protein